MILDIHVTHIIWSCIRFFYT